MNQITWLDLYNFLYENANNIKGFGEFDWNKPITIHDAETGDEYTCDTYFISDNVKDDKLVLVINSQSIFN